MRRQRSGTREGEIGWQWEGERFRLTVVGGDERVQDSPVQRELFDLVLAALHALDLVQRRQVEELDTILAHVQLREILESHRGAFFV
jgi:hypothetical protein